VAEVVWGALGDRQDMLHLLARVAQAFGARGLDDYETPSEQLAELFDDDEPERVETGTEERAMQVMAFVDAAGGG